MTIKQLLAWVAYAHDRHDCSFDEVANKHTICLKQALLEGEPKIESHGYAVSEGERELAIVLIHTCNYQEVCDMENDAYDISREPMTINTRVHRTPVPDEPTHYITATEAIRQAQEARAAFTGAPTLHNTINNEPPIGEILYRQGQIAEERPSLPSVYMSGDTDDSPLRQLSVEESRTVMQRALDSMTQSPGVSTHE